ncbi:SDR family NAD(P)-dependent oxidoreductase [Lysinibacillus endophyticus]|uniref:SDR family NAD(P)-dependent oxidoreductase n=1 Tax=Ureibacillus endophyticus TaxID=1978490 RepID=UPI0020A07FF6|nr:3-oxoacyl-ACP reductase FabG [Lysinibacillus endophyticus]MCP1146688.1 3-oxoacyl-ACP reductase FabG [Lysinibacillus endophyticus]
MGFYEKVAIITGGARGIGAETAIQLAKDGANIAIFDIQDELFEGILSKLRNLGVTAQAWKVDITQKENIQQAVQEVYDTFGKIDILINSAGVLKDNLLPNLEEDEWDFVLDVNLKGAYLVTQAVHPYMVKQGSGRIIFISSQAALGAKGRVNYSAAKAGIQGMTRTLAIELGPKGITVNAVAPGFVDTEMSLVSAASASKRGISNFEKVKEQLVQSNPIRRTGTPEDIAHAILFFASDKAGYINGQVLYVTGAP